jgi:hypothetical protein
VNRGGWGPAGFQVRPVSFFFLFFPFFELAFYLTQDDDDVRLPQQQLCRRRRWRRPCAATAAAATRTAMTATPGCHNSSSDAEDDNADTGLPQYMQDASGHSLRQRSLLDISFVILKKIPACDAALDEVCAIIFLSSSNCSDDSDDRDCSTTGWRFTPTMTPPTLWYALIVMSPASQH